MVNVDSSSDTAFIYFEITNLESAQVLVIVLTCFCQNIFLFFSFFFFFTKLNKDSAAVGVKPAAESGFCLVFRISASIHYASWTLSEVCRMLKFIMARGQLPWWISSEPHAPLRPPSAQTLCLTHQPQDKHRPNTSERANFINIFNKSCSNSKG